MSKYYAVRVGRKTGVFDNWVDCKQQTVKYPKAEFKSFFSYQEALNYLNEKSVKLNAKNTVTENRFDFDVLSDSEIAKIQKNLKFRTLKNGLNVSETYCIKKKWKKLSTELYTDCW